MKTLRTWSGRNKFQYSGSVVTGTSLKYGRDYRWSAHVPATTYSELLTRFAGQTIKIGTSRNQPPGVSLGHWLQQHVTKTALASYVGPILIDERYAERGPESDEIHIKR